MKTINERRDRKTADGNSILHQENVGGLFLFDCDYDLRLLNLRNMPTFYIDILKTWNEVQGLCNDFHQNNIRSSIVSFFKNKIIVQRAIAQSKGQMDNFNFVWKPFLSLLEKLKVG